MGRHDRVGIGSDPAAGGMRRAAVTAVIAVMALTGCSRVDSLALPTPPPTAPASSTTVAPNLTGVHLAGVAGTPTSVVAVGPGGATLSGTVVGTAGPVGGANVHIERLVGDGVGAVDVITAPDGTWSMPGVLGGRYRVRAWRSPDLALVDPQIFFLNGTDNKSMTLQLQQFNATTLTAASAPVTPVVGQPVVVAVGLSSQVVDAKGIVTAKPVANAAVQLISGGGWTVGDPNPTVTGPDGSASWNAVCQQVGPQTLTAIVNTTDTYQVNLPSCDPAPLVTPTGPTGGTTTVPGPGTTATTAPGTTRPTPPAT